MRLLQTKWWLFFVPTLNPSSKERVEVRQFGLLFLLMILLECSFGQNNYVLKVVSSDQPATFFQRKFSYKEHFRDSIQSKAEVKNLMDKLQAGGYIASSLDSLTVDTLVATAYIYVGRKYEHLLITSGNVDDKLLIDAGLKNSVINEKPISFDQAQTAKQNLLHACENDGYPFASVKLDSFIQQGDLVTASIYLQKNEVIRFDTLHIIGKTRVKKIFLKNYLSIKPGRPYNESYVQKINQRIRDLQFLELAKPSTVAFVNGRAITNLYLKDKRASQFDFLVGFLPGASGQKLLITGDANLNLFSMFGLGEQFYLQWQKLEPLTQTLDVKVVYPYLLGLPLGINISFDLIKEDTTFVNINGDYGIQYQLIGNSYIKASLQQKITIVTSVDTNYIIEYRALPPDIDLSTNSFALQYYVQQYDYKFNPTSGYEITFGASAGVRTIHKSSTIEGLYDEVTGQTFSFLYDTTRLSEFQFQVALAAAKYWRLAARHTIKTSFDGKYLYGKQLYQNEMYQIGGVNSLRGFDDLSIFTPYYAMGNVEYRFLLSKNSYVSAFYNAAFIKSTVTASGFDIPYGFGVGAAIETKAGVFGITYALGKQAGSNLSFANAKIHLGYVNYF